jgi:hypothetical protein
MIFTSRGVPGITNSNIVFSLAANAGNKPLPNNIVDFV